MEFASYEGEATVLFLHDSPGLEESVDDRFPALPTRFASTLADAYAAFDSTVSVVLVDDAVPAEDADEFSHAVLSRNPFCQFVLLASAGGTTTEHATDYDAVLRRPVTESGFRDVLERRLTYGVYSTVLHEYYSLNARAATIQLLAADDPESEADDSGSEADDEPVGETKGLEATERGTDASETQVDDEGAVPDDIRNRLQTLRPLLRRLEATLENDDIRQISKSVRRHRRYLTQSDADSTSASKYHPGACPECGLSWGGEPRAELGRGFLMLGADVWRCTRCGEVVHGLHDTNQRVNRG